MHLFIFNFKIKIILILFLIFFILFNIVLSVLKPDTTLYQNQWQQNIAVAQDFIYENNPKNIIIGSSMSARVDNRFLDGKYYNLSFSGGNAATGLEVIKKSGVIPNSIFIEANTVFEKKDSKFIETLFYPIFWQVKYFIPSFQEKNQPLNFIISKLAAKSNEDFHNKRMLETQNKIIYEQSLQRLIIEYNNDYKFGDDVLIDLKTSIDYFEGKGTKIFFYYMPISNKLINSRKSLKIRNALKSNFDNQWIQFNNSYLTTDGIHLVYSSAYKFSKDFLIKANSIVEKNNE